MEESNTVNFGFEKTSPDEKTRRVQEVFDHSAEKYNIMNDIMSLGMHYSWKRKAVEYAQIRPGDKVLDLACGTCDISYYLHQKQSDLEIFATDPNEKMLRQGQDMLLNNGIYRSVHYSLSFAEALPFNNDLFQAVICAFGFRNFTNHRKALDNLYRVIQPGGQLIILEFSKPNAQIIKSLYTTYAEIIPNIGKMIAQEQNSYQYLVDSIENHMDQKELTAQLCAAGFESIKVTELLSGLVSIHRGIKC